MPATIDLWNRTIVTTVTSCDPGIALPLTQVQPPRPGWLTPPHPPWLTLAGLLAGRLARVGSEGLARAATGIWTELTDRWLGLPPDPPLSALLATGARQLGSVVGADLSELRSTYSGQLPLGCPDFGLGSDGAVRLPSGERVWVAWVSEEGRIRDLAVTTIGVGSDGTPENGSAVRRRLIKLVLGRTPLHSQAVHWSPSYAAAVREAGVEEVGADEVDPLALDWIPVMDRRLRYLITAPCRSVVPSPERLALAMVCVNAGLGQSVSC